MSSPSSSTSPPPSAAAAAHAAAASLTGLLEARLAPNTHPLRLPPVPGKEEGELNPAYIQKHVQDLAR